MEKIYGRKIVTLFNSQQEFFLTVHWYVFLFLVIYIFLSNMCALVWRYAFWSINFYRKVFVCDLRDKRKSEGIAFDDSCLPGKLLGDIHLSNIWSIEWIKNIWSLYSYQKVKFTYKTDMTIIFTLATLWI